MTAHLHSVVRVVDNRPTSPVNDIAQSPTQALLRQRLSSPAPGQHTQDGRERSDSPDALGSRKASDNAWSQEIVLEDGQLRVYVSLYRVSSLAFFSYAVLCIATGGIAFVLSRWFPLTWCRLFGVPLERVHDEHLLSRHSSPTSPTSAMSHSSATIAAAATGDKSPPRGRTWVVVQNSWQQTFVSEVRREVYNGALRNVFSDEMSGGEPDATLYQLLWFDYRCIKYVWHPLQHRFAAVGAWKDRAWVAAAASGNGGVAVLKNGIHQSMYYERRQVLGSNDIVIPEKSTVQLIFDEILHPFYIFQVFSIILWSLDDYYYYASCILFISVLSTVDALVETKRNIRRLREMSHFSCSVNVYRSSQWTRVQSDDLVPGDVIEVNAGDFHTLPCDVVLLAGDCIVNESMLTGESVPMFKVPLQSVGLLVDADLHEPQVSAGLSRSFLFSGTRIVRVRGSHVADDVHEGRATAMVVRTGFNTTKGSLIRSMLFPHPHKFSFYRDAFRFIGVLAIIASIGFAFSLYYFIRHHASIRIIILRALDLVTIIIPPALPATMSIGTSFALSRLKRANIYCISPNTVNVCGKVNMVCFDKTGTLTEEGLDVMGVHVHTGQKFSDLLRTSSDIAAATSAANTTVPLSRALATCHGLKMVNGECVGDPLELKMFEWTGWELEESGPGTGDTLGSSDAQHANIVPTCVRPPAGSLFAKADAARPEFGILKTFEFASTLRRMTVLVKQLSDSALEIFTKGAPEVMRDICRPDSIPEDYDTLLMRLTQKGYRVIAVAAKTLPHTTFLKAQKLTRAEVESELTFLGFLVFENKLKPGSSAAIAELSRANIRQVMCTGDNALTAISVSRDCGIVGAGDNVFVGRLVGDPLLDAECLHVVWELSDDPRVTLDPYILRYSGDAESQVHRATPFHLAVTGDVFQWMLSHAGRDVCYRMLYKGQVFARMSPDQKQELVEKYQEMGYCVAFCGDGANDCGALKAADVGLSLSEAEASVAAPFTSKTTEVHCMLDLIKQGRAALVTSFSCFKYMALYSFIQFTSVTALYTIASNLGDFQFLYIDLLLILPLAVFMGRAEAYHTIVAKRPTANLLSKKVITSLVGHILIQLVVQVFALRLVQSQPWYEAPNVDPDNRQTKCMENTTLFWVSSFQYIIMAVVFSVGPPYRKSMTKNVLFILSALVLTIISVLTVISPTHWLREVLELSKMPAAFRFSVILLAFINFIVCWVAESYLFTPLSGWIARVRRAARHSFVSQDTLYRQLQSEADKQKVFKRVAREFP
ncbi:hypothetical protein RI367_002039 [Sorochytrium milnesiophthora]